MYSNKVSLMAALDLQSSNWTVSPTNSFGICRSIWNLFLGSVVGKEKIITLLRVRRRLASFYVDF